jgi:protein tyrosine/serine phosphatase
VTAQRHVEFDSVFNFRDLGGYATGDGRAVRWRIAYRADGVHRLGVDELGSLGIKTVVDLRTKGEIDERGRFTHDSIGYHHLPLLESIWDRSQYPDDAGALRYLADRYAEMLDEGAPAIRRALHLLADPDAVPLVFHCAAGKDRTGVVAAVTLSLLGVSDDDIASDYALSRAGMDRMSAWLKETYPEYAEEMATQPTAFLDSPTDAMHLFLAELREQFGSVEEYAVTVDMTDDDVERLRANLLEPHADQ